MKYTKYFIDVKLQNKNKKNIIKSKKKIKVVKTLVVNVKNKEKGKKIKTNISKEKLKE